MASTLITMGRSMTSRCLMVSAGGFGMGHRFMKGTGLKASSQVGEESSTLMDLTMSGSTKTGLGMVLENTTNRR